jgi:hypothetical protein
MTLLVITALSGSTSQRSGTNPRISAGLYPPQGGKEQGRELGLYRLLEIAKYI